MIKYLYKDSDNMKPIVLAILDGFGLREEEHGNAVKQAYKPNFDYLWNN